MEGTRAHARRGPPSLASIADEFGFSPAPETVGENSSSVAENTGEGDEAGGERDAWREDGVVELSHPTRSGKWPPGVRLAALKGYLQFCRDNGKEPSRQDEDGFECAFTSANGSAPTTNRQLPTLQQTVTMWANFRKCVSRLRGVKQKCEGGELRRTAARAEELRHLRAFEAMLKAISAMKLQFKGGQVAPEGVIAEALAAGPDPPRRGTEPQPARRAQARAQSSEGHTVTPPNSSGQHHRSTLPQNYAGETRYGRGVFSSAVPAMRAYEAKMANVADAIVVMSDKFTHAVDVNLWMVRALARTDPRLTPFAESYPAAPRKRREPETTGSEDGQEDSPRSRFRGEGAAAAAAPLGRPTSVPPAHGEERVQAPPPPSPLLTPAYVSGEADGYLASPELLPQSRETPEERPSDTRHRRLRETAVAAAAAVPATPQWYQGIHYQQSSGGDV